MKSEYRLDPMWCIENYCKVNCGKENRNHKVFYGTVSNDSLSEFVGSVQDLQPNLDEEIDLRIIQNYKMKRYEVSWKEGKVDYMFYISIAD